MNKSKGLFITLEGGEGSGKTTVSVKMKAALERMGYEVMLTREPGGVSVAESIRSVILSEEMDATTEAFLFAAARREHLVKKVQPALDKGMVVICDRFVHSSLVYQGYVRGLGIEKVFDINRFAIGDLMPDMTLYLDLPPEIGIERIYANGERELNRLDEAPMEFHRQVREGFLMMPTLYPEQNFLQLDASQSPDKVYIDAMIRVNELLKGVIAS